MIRVVAEDQLVWNKREGHVEDQNVHQNVLQFFLQNMTFTDLTVALPRRYDMLSIEIIMKLNMLCFEHTAGILLL